MEYIRPDEWREMSWERVMLDVRTPAEFAQGHLGGARNLPLFSDEERVAVGTLYKQESPDAAYLQGLEFAGRKMRWYVEEARRLAPAGTVLVHCWRGGQRSASIAWLLEKAGFDVLVLEGGYKAMRQYYRQYLNWWDQPIAVLGGHTGCGKTHILHELKKQREQVIDLEKLANHKGSAFGGLGEVPQPSTEQFENTLFETILDLPTRGAPVWIENESRTVGKVYVPDELWEKMREGTLVHLDVPHEVRVQNLVGDYACFPDTELIEAFSRIKKRLGGQHLNRAVEAIQEKDYATAASIALRYYDKSYAYFLEQWDPDRRVDLHFDTFEPELIARQLIEWRKAEAK